MLNERSNMERTVEERDWIITSTPQQPWSTGYGHFTQKVRARNQLEALDIFAQAEGFSGYTEAIALADSETSIGADEYGMWATYTNTTIWAIPFEKAVGPVTAEEVNVLIGDLLSHDNDVLGGLLPGTTIRVIDAAREAYAKTPEEPAKKKTNHIETFKYAGIWITCARNETSGQLIVNINTEGVKEGDQDEDGDPYLEITLNGFTYYNREEGREE